MKHQHLSQTKNAIAPKGQREGIANNPETGTIMPLTIINDKVKTILLQLRSQFETFYGDRLVQMILFGSQARGDAHPDSDIDVLVVLKGAVNPGDEIEQTGNIVADLSLKNDALISCLFIEEYRFINRNSPLLRNIRKEGIAL